MSVGCAEMSTPVLTRLLVVLSLAAALVWLGDPATAHPFGQPPQAVVTAEGRDVTVRWQAPPDDTRALGAAVGALPEGGTSVFEFDDEGNAVQRDGADEAGFGDSPALREYLREHIDVSQEGSPCPVEDVRAGDMLAQGATLTFTCPEIVSEAELAVTMLTDVHPAYRTVSYVGDASRGVLHTRDDPAQTLDFDGGGSGTPLVVPVAATVGVLVVGLLVAGLRRRRSRVGGPAHA